MLKNNSLKQSILGATCVLALSATASFAQDRGACGQPSALTAGRYQIAGENMAPIETTVSIARGEPAYLELEVRGSGGITIETYSRDSDPILILYDRSGRVVRTDDDGTGTLNSRLGIELTQGVYCAQVRTLTGIPDPVGMLPPGFDVAIPVRISGGVQASSSACLSNPSLTRIPDGLALGADARHLQNILSGSGSSVAFTLTESMPLAISLSSNQFDTMLTLEDASGAQFGFDDDGGGGLNSYLAFNAPLPAGEYCALVTSYGENGAGQYDLVIEEWTPNSGPAIGGNIVPVEPCGPDNAMTVAAPLGTGFATQILAQTLNNGFGHVRFSLSEPNSLRLTTISGDFDTVLSLYTAEGNQIAENDDADGIGLNSRIQTGAQLPAGDYCVAVRSYSGSGVGVFELTLSELSEAALLVEAYGRGELVPTADSGVAMNDLGLLERSLRVDTVGGGGADWFLFEVGEESLVVVDAASAGDVARLVLFDYEGTGREIAQSSLSNDLMSNRLVEQVGSGIYAIAVVREAGAASFEASPLSIQRYVRPARAQ